jgi:hypothetical protein
MAKKRVRKEPIIIEGVMNADQFMAMMKERVEELEKNPPPPTPEEQAEIDALLTELSKDPGFMRFRL